MQNEKTVLHADQTEKPVAATAAEQENAGLNHILAAVDTCVQTHPDPLKQLAILTLAAALATRRILGQSRSVASRGGRMKLIKAAVSDFESKLKRHALPSVAPAEDIKA